MGLVFTAERECVYFAVRNEALCEIQVHIILSKVKKLI